jgi:hypothetical protein
MKRMSIDWSKVAVILRADDPEALISCPSCRAEGSVPYIAEHVLTTHPESQPGRRLAKLVREGRASA